MAARLSRCLLSKGRVQHPAAQYWPITEPGSYYTFASGGLGWGEPKAVGVAIAQKKMGTGRPVVAAIGDGALQ